MDSSGGRRSAPPGCTWWEDGIRGDAVHRQSMGTKLSDTWEDSAEPWTLVPAV
ncbi:hypothetical protein O3G_MSEX015379 [Manduca sexta]|uniref:Uncharacterized protein n=1 Tax=Manduca sexta TaxID=7130 RepID=A0A922CZS6_MANSE|nr:hypothetical protein O3G_MSEX015379 [Manduca sexta]